MLVARSVLNSNLLDLIQGDLIIGSVIKFGGSGTLVRGHSLGVFKGTTIVEIGSDPCGSEGVIANRRGDAGGLRAALKHAPGVGLGHTALAQHTRSSYCGPKNHSLAVVRNAGVVEVILQIALEVVVAGHGVLFTTFFVEANPEPAMLPVDVADVHPESRANAGEGVDEQGDQRPVAQDR